MKSMFGALLAVLLAGGVFFLYTRPAYDNIHVLQDQIATYDQALDKAAQLQKIKQDLLARYNSFSQEDKDRLQKLLPDHVDNIALILDVDHMAGTHGMALENVDVSSVATNETSQQQTASSVVAASTKKYNMLTLKFSVHSTYDEFQKFISDLQSSLRIVDLDSLTIAADQTASPGSGTRTYRYDIALRTYWLK